MYIVPLGQDQEFYERPYLTWFIALACIIIYGAIDQTSLGFKYHDPSFLKAITSNFAHGNVQHLIGNLIGILLFGSALECFYRRWAYLFVMVFCGVVGSYAGQLLIKQGFEVGASGMVYGLMGGYLVLFPKGKLRFGYMIFMIAYVRAGTVRVYAWIVATLYLGIDILSIFTGLQPHVSHMAHLAGFIAGVLGTICMKRLNFIAEDAGIEFAVSTQSALRSKTMSKTTVPWTGRIESARKIDSNESD
ncbi:MAG: rhomboid family intramembrane serine protease [Myxococcota bacterium]|nr:rhomboid family intramembrane serine protease [Myxococcota bacterium]